MTFELHLQTIFDDLRNCNEQVNADRAGFFRQFLGLPPTIKIGERMAYVSQKSVGAIREIARMYRENSAEYRRALPHDEMANLISNAIGSVLGASTSSEAKEFPVPTDPHAFWVMLRDQLSRDLVQLNRELTHLFGAWVIQGDTIPCIDVGPVRFVLRMQWVSDAVASGLLTENQASQLRQFWERGIGINPDPTEGFDGYCVKDIAEAIGPCPWVCVVKIFGHTHTRSRQKALLAAHIALAAISLAWEMPSPQAKETGLFYDIGPARTRHTIMFKEERFAGASHEGVLRLGRFLSVNDATIFNISMAQSFKTVAAALDIFLSTNPTDTKTLLEEALCHSLIWFSEACDEPLEFLVIVKFTAALDTLAKGRQVRGICELIRHRYPVSDLDAPFLGDGTSAKLLVTQIYEMGRSRIVHGVRSSLIDDLDQLRARAEMLATIVLKACIFWLDTYAGPDDVSAFSKSA